MTKAVRALLALEWQLNIRRFNSGAYYCPSCGKGGDRESPPAVHGDSCLLHAALVDAGYPDQESRFAARSALLDSCPEPTSSTSS